MVYAETEFRRVVPCDPRGVRSELRAPVALDVLAEEADGADVADRSGDERHLRIRVARPLLAQCWPRTSSSMFARTADVNSPTTVLVRSRSVPLLETALIVVSESAFPVALALSAVLLLKL